MRKRGPRVTCLQECGTLAVITIFIVIGNLIREMIHLSNLLSNFFVSYWVASLLALKSICSHALVM